MKTVLFTRVVMFFTNMMTGFLTGTTSDVITGLDFDIFSWISEGLQKIGDLFTVFPYNILFWFALVVAVIKMGLSLIPRKK